MSKTESPMAEDPFQMDEDLSPEIEDGVCRAQSRSNSPYYTEVSSGVDLLGKRIVPNLSDLEKLQAQDRSDKVADEEERIYEEDLDDNLDITYQKQLEEEYLSHINSFKELTPPENFAPVINKIYRSSFPQPNNFTFLKKLKLKSILCLIPEEYPKLQSEFIRQENIKLFKLGMSGNKEPFVHIPSDLITEAIKIVLNPENQPILIHCNRGKHRTGCLVGIIRRLQKWSLTIIFDEYRKFASPKERPMDQQFIELYDDTDIIKYAEKNGNIPLSWD